MNLIKRHFLNNKQLILWALFLNFGQIFTFDLIQSVKCRLYECCSPPYLPNNFTQLEENLNKSLFGQPLVQSTIVSALRGHFNLNGPKKALVMSFHGSTGVGKNFVVQFIANSMFERGVKSKFFKLFIASRDFPHNEKIDEYRETIIKTIETTVKQCHTNLFVFDETDKIPIGLIDTIKAYIDFYTEVDGIAFRKSVFIFLSNSAAKDIAQLTLSYDKQNVYRDDFQLKVFQTEIQNSIYHNKEANEKGLWHASIIDSYLIDFYVPFLPLERDHVRKCIRAEFRNYNYTTNKTNESGILISKITDSDIENIVDEHVYEPPGHKKYSSSGCKRVPFLVRTFIYKKMLSSQLNDEF
ncbi:unnamed protein product [Brachionus calyciflorus]|uniref:Uncharacterized protein n=1 Tax=Brachionus calyciflorus TaxID=104777 RepID=A0A814APD5_9BILA|nr:unnamed protein product [Brachionus calyciflorus]